jgi:hypothetical protein
MPVFTTKSTPNTTNSAGGVNNAIKDPFQGYDCNVWMLDAAGRLVNRGFFTSVQFTFRNATEPYMEMGQRVPRYLDGDFQIGWVAQRGMLDMATIQETLGFPAVTRSARVGRSPRFTLVFYINAAELASAEDNITAPGDLSRLNNSYGNDPLGSAKRSTKGKIVLLNCKLDTFALGAQSGQKVIANQWEGLAEGYQVITSNDKSATFTNEEKTFQRTFNSGGALNAQDNIAGVGKDLKSFYNVTN